MEICYITKSKCVFVVIVIFSNFSRKIENRESVRNARMYFGNSWCIFYYRFDILNTFIGFCVFFCIYDHNLKICLNIFSKMSQKCDQFSYELFV